MSPAARARGPVHATRRSGQPRPHLRAGGSVVVPPQPLEATIASAIPDTSGRQYTIFVGSDQTVVSGRGAAVSEAKDISRRTGRPIRVERIDGRVRMEFRRGSLESYRYETRDRRS